MTASGPPMLDTTPPPAATRSLPQTPSELAPVVGAVIRYGVLMARSGAAAFRIRETMLRTASALGVMRCEFLVHLDAIAVTVFSDHGEFRTRVVRIPEIGVNMSRLCRLEVLSRDLAAQPASWSVDRLTSLLDEIEHEPPLYPRWATVPLLGLACGAFCGVIKGNGWQMGAAFVGASLGHIVRLRLIRRHTPVVTLVVSCAFASALGSHVSARLLGLVSTHFGYGPVTPGQAVLASVLYLVPGVPLVTSLLDVVNFDLTAGLARAAFASMVVVCIAIGMLAFLSLTGFALT